MQALGHGAAARRPLRPREQAARPRRRAARGVRSRLRPDGFRVSKRNLSRSFFQNENVSKIFHYSVLAKKKKENCDLPCKKEETSAVVFERTGVEERSFFCLHCTFCNSTKKNIMVRTSCPSSTVKKQKKQQDKTPKKKEKLVTQHQIKSQQKNQLINPFPQLANVHCTTTPILHSIRFTNSELSLDT